MQRNHSKVGPAPIPAPYEESPSLTYVGATPKHSPPVDASGGLLDKLISIRSLLLGITLLIVVAMAAGLISISVTTQAKIVNDLAGQIQDRISLQIEREIFSLFNDIDTSVTLAELMFHNKTVPAEDHQFLLTGWAADILEPMWTTIRRKPKGSRSQFQFQDARMIGVESYNDVPLVYWEDVYGLEYNASGWHIELNQTIASTNFSLANTAYAFMYPIPFGLWFYNLNRPFLTKCNDGHYWWDLIFFYGEGMNIVLQPCYALFCNAKGEKVGYFDVSASIEGIEDTLSKALNLGDEDNLKGKTFIVDDNQQIVASSTKTNAFNVSLGWSATRMNVTNTDEIWVKQVAERLNGNYGDHRRTESFNGTRYFVNVKRYSLGLGNPYIIVSLLEEQQFLEKSNEARSTNIIAAVVLSVASLLIMFLVVYYITKPLFLLARDLRRMAQLDLDFESMQTPRLFEVGKLHKSFISMYAALKSFKKFVPESIIKNIIHTSVEVKAQLIPRNISIIFQDIQAFTGLAETMDPTTLAQMTGEYMEVMTEILCKHSATIDKYIGDCIMSLFNAPDDVANHAAQATAAAVECLQVLKEKNKEWKRKYGQEMWCRFGINTGECLVGNMGGVHRMNYTAIGDNVNIAARLETANKYFGSRLIVSKSVYQTLPPGKFLTRRLAKVRVSGKQEATTIYEVSDEPHNSTLVQMYRLYENALEAHCKMDFEEAEGHLLKALELVPNDPASARLLARNRPLITDVPVGWDHIENLNK